MKPNGKQHFKSSAAEAHAHSYWDLLAWVWILMGMFFTLVFAIAKPYINLVASRGHPLLILFLYPIMLWLITSLGGKTRSQAYPGGMSVRYTCSREGYLKLCRRRRARYERYHKDDDLPPF